MCLYAVLSTNKIQIEVLTTKTNQLKDELANITTNAQVIKEYNANQIEKLMSQNITLIDELASYKMDCKSTNQN